MLFLQLYFRTTEPIQMYTIVIEINNFPATIIIRNCKYSSCSLCMPMAKPLFVTVVLFSFSEEKVLKRNK